MPPTTPAPHHSLLEDAQALLAGTLLVSLGVAMLGKANLITGGAVGLALLLHYASGIGFGPLFFAVNLPFYLLAWKKMGLALTYKTLLAVSLLSLLSGLMPHALQIATIHPLYAPIIGGLLMGVGLLILFRHRSSLGGFNILVLYLQERFGWRAGIIQMALDTAILLCALPMISLLPAALSILGAAVLNLTLAINHRPGRYMAI